MPAEVICYTSANIGYLDRALVLLDSIRRTNPDWHVVLVLVDEHLGLDDNRSLLSRFDEVLTSRDLIGPSHAQWIFGHDVVEACTAIKGAALAVLLAREPRVVVYLDPDTCVFRSMTPILDVAQGHDLCLTPHQLRPARSRRSLEDNEIGSMRTGIFNLGFLMVRPTPEGWRFARWWEERLTTYCYDDQARGLFTDQKWLDHAPVFFPGLGILRQPGLNVASWNLDERRLSVDAAGEYQVNDEPLYFWHFTKATTVGPTMTLRYGARDSAVAELWRYYIERLAYTTVRVVDREWAFSRFTNGDWIPAVARSTYRSRDDLKSAFPTPFDAAASPSYHRWLRDSGTWSPES